MPIAKKNSSDTTPRALRAHLPGPASRNACCPHAGRTDSTMLTDTRLGPADHERRAARLKVSVQGSRILSTSSQNIFPGRRFLRLEVLSARPFDQGRQAARPRALRTLNTASDRRNTKGPSIHTCNRCVGAQVQTQDRAHSPKAAAYPAQTRGRAQPRRAHLAGPSRDPPRTRKKTSLFLLTAAY